GAGIDASVAHCVLQLLHCEEGARGLWRVECVRDDDVVWIVDRAQHLVRSHAVLGLDRREAVVHRLPRVEVRYLVPDDSNGAHETSSRGCPAAKDGLMRSPAAKATPGVYSARAGRAFDPDAIRVLSVGPAVGARGKAKGALERPAEGEHRFVADAG